MGIAEIYSKACAQCKSIRALLHPINIIIGTIGIYFFLVRPYIVPYFLPRQDTELEWRMMQRATRLTMNIYPTQYKLMLMIDKVEMDIDMLQERLDSYTQFYQTNGWFPEEIRKKVEGYMDHIMAYDVSIGILMLQHMCRQFWELYYWEEYEWNRDLIDNNGYGDYHYFRNMSYAAEKAFERKMFNLDQQLHQKHWKLMIDILKISHFPTYADVCGKGKKQTRSFKIVLDKGELKRFYKKFEDNLGFKCYFRRGETIPYSELEDENDWGLDGVRPSSNVILTKGASQRTMIKLASYIITYNNVTGKNEVFYYKDGS